jgi:glucosyl-3-phosphoglycerate synthase
VTHHDAPWTLTAEDFNVMSVLARAGSTSITVIIPAKNEAATIGAVIDAATRHDGLVSQLLVVNDHSNDDTAAVAHRHGAEVVTLDGPSGKGEAMSAGLRVATSELVVFLDADVLNTTTDFVPRLVQPLLERPEIQLVKGYYERPLHNMPTGGGRVNELAARPILALLYPGLGEIRQPLAGETAGRTAIDGRGRASCGALASQGAATSASVTTDALRGRGPAGRLRHRPTRPRRPLDYAAA